ncbi:MAG: FtsX-like permease family protein, partial [Actinomycetota bacterium]
GDVTSYERVRATPLVLAGLLSLLATAAIAHALITSVRRRGRDLAIMKSVGFVRRQVSATVAWQATTMMVISLVVGIPAGIAAGRAIWSGFAGRLGIPSEPIVPMAVVLLGIVGSLVVANAAAAWPGARAARVQPAVALRDE